MLVGGAGNPLPVDVVRELLKEYFDSGERKHLRFGQWCFNYYIAGAPWPELFYNEDITDSCRMVKQYLTDKGVKKVPKRLGL